METKLARITEIAKSQPKVKFTSLAHLIDERALYQCHMEQDGKKAVGVDGATKAEYDQRLDENLANLVKRLKQKAYRPLPVRRTYIEKAGSRQKRPLGIPAYEDKLVQSAVAKILEAIYEADFLDSSFGFRPNRSCHDALKILNVYIEKRKTNYIVDADIKGFFDHVDHDWLMRFLEHRIADTSLLRLIKRFLKAGVMEAGIRHDTPVGTPQGGIVSPILGNVYLHYVLDLWFEKVVRKQCKGQAYMVRYADDYVCCFQYKEDAEAFYRAMVMRLKKFNLTIAEEKTRILPFGRSSEDECRKQGMKRPPTFDFLGFTHYVGKSQKGAFRVKRKTSSKKFRSSLKRCKEWLKENRIVPAQLVMDSLKRKLIGYYRYYGITDNVKMVDNFREKVRQLLYKWFNRRSQKKSFNWDKFHLFLKQHPLPRPKRYVDIYELRNEISYCW
jgi:RNA-directed DNA polymerase